MDTLSVLSEGREFCFTIFEKSRRILDKPVENHFETRVEEQRFIKAYMINVFGACPKLLRR